VTKDKASTEATAGLEPEGDYSQVKTIKETPKGQPNVIGPKGGASERLDYNGSTYPDREKDLQKAHGYLPENIDAVRRARANGSRMPASAIGLTVDGEIVEDQ